MGAVMKRRWWLLGAVLVVLIAGAGVLTWRQLHPNTPTRAAVASAVPGLDSAIAEVVAATGDGAAVTVSGLVPTTSCSGGRLYTVTADLYTNPGDEAALIDRIAAALPASMHPSRSPGLGGGAETLNATLGGGDQLQIIQLDTGWVAATATTDCRADRTASPSPAAPADQALTSVLAALDTTPTTWHSDAVVCASGRITTLSTASQPISLDGIAARLAQLPPRGAIVFTSPSDRISWRVGPVSTVIAAADSGTHLTAQTTTSC